MRQFGLFALTLTAMFAMPLDASAYHRTTTRTTYHRGGYGPVWYSRPAVGVFVSTPWVSVGVPRIVSVPQPVIVRSAPIYVSPPTPEVIVEAGPVVVAAPIPVRTVYVTQAPVVRHTTVTRTRTQVRGRVFGSGCPGGNCP